MYQIPQRVHQGVTWYNLDKIDPEMMNLVLDNFHFHDLEIEHLQKPFVHPKINHYDDYVSLILHFPIIQDNFITQTAKLHIILGEKYIFTFQDKPLPEINKFFEEFSTLPDNEIELQTTSGYVLYQILKRLYDECFQILSFQESTIEDLEDKIFEGDMKDNIQDILHIKREIITLRRILGLQRDLVKKLKDKSFSFLNKNIHHYFDSIIDQSNKIWDILEVHKENIEAMQDANEANISHRTNRVMQLLTVFSVVMLPLTFMVGLFGMNVSLPMENNIHAFSFLLLIMSGITALLLILFYWKKWM